MTSQAPDPLPKSESESEAVPGKPSDDSAEESFELIRRAQEGELDAYERLFRRYYKRVHAIVRQRLGPALRADIESLDIVQDAMIDAVRGFQNFELRDEGALTAWMAAIVENRIRGTRKYLYAAKRDRRRDIHFEQIADHLSQSNASAFHPQADVTPPPEACAKRAEVEVLLESLDALPDRYREILVLRDQKGLPWEEVAERLGRPSADAARMMHAKAKIALRKEMKQRGY